MKHTIEASDEVVKATFGFTKTQKSREFDELTIINIVNKAMKSSMGRPVKFYLDIKDSLFHVEVTHELEEGETLSLDSAAVSREVIRWHGFSPNNTAMSISQL